MQVVPKIQITYHKCCTIFKQNIVHEIMRPPIMEGNTLIEDMENDGSRSLYYYDLRRIWTLAPFQYKGIDIDTRFENFITREMVTYLQIIVFLG